MKRFPQFGLSLTRALRFSDNLEAKAFEEYSSAAHPPEPKTFFIIQLIPILGLILQMNLSIIYDNRWFPKTVLKTDTNQKVPSIGYSLTGTAPCHIRAVVFLI